jgi:hypothetical protein
VRDKCSREGSYLDMAELANGLDVRKVQRCERRRRVNVCLREWVAAQNAQPLGDLLSRQSCGYRSLDVCYFTSSTLRLRILLAFVLMEWLARRHTAPPLPPRLIQSREW